MAKGIRTLSEAQKQLKQLARAKKHLDALYRMDLDRLLRIMGLDGPNGMVRDLRFRVEREMLNQ